jgi:hypothetical protein
MDPPPGREAEWNDWYNKEHIPGRLEIPGFLAIRRFEVSKGFPKELIVPGPKYLTLVELADIDVLTSKSYISLCDREVSLPSDSFEAITATLPNLSGGVYEQIFPDEEEYEIPDADKFLHAVGHADLPPEIEEEYNAWYVMEHIPSLIEIPGYLYARRFKRADGEFMILPSAQISGPQYLAFYDITNDKLFETAAFKERSSTPWMTRVRRWTFHRRQLNDLYRCIYLARR